MREWSSSIRSRQRRGTRVDGVRGIRMVSQTAREKTNQIEPDQGHQGNPGIPNSCKKAIRVVGGQKILYRRYRII